MVCKFYCFYVCLLQDHIAYYYETPAYLDSDSQSSSSQYQEYQDSPSPLSDRGDRKDRDSLPLIPLSGTLIYITSTQLIHTPNIYAFSVKTRTQVHTSMSHYHLLYSHPLPCSQERGRSGCSSSYLRCFRRHRCGVASGGSNLRQAHFSFPPKTKSAWRNCGAGARVIASP